MYQKSRFFKIIVCMLLVTSFNIYCHADESILKNYLNNQLEKDEILKSNNVYRQDLIQKTKTQFFDISKLSSYGSYTYNNFQIDGSVELGFYFRLYDQKKKIESEISKNELFDFDMSEEYVVQNIIFNNLNNYFNFIIYKQMGKEFEELFEKVNKNSLKYEDILIYNDQKIKEEENKLMLNHFQNDDFEMIYELLGIEIFTKEFYNQIGKKEIFYRLVENNIELKKLCIKDTMDGLENKINYSYPRIYLDGSYQYNFNNTHELQLNLNINMQIPTKWNNLDIDMSFKKNKVSYYINYLKNANINKDNKENLNEQNHNLISRLENQYINYLNAIKITQKKLANSRDKLIYYKENSNNGIEFLNSYLNEKVIYLNNLKELNNYYLSILLIGNVSDIMNYLR